MFRVSDIFLEVILAVELRNTHWLNDSDDEEDDNDDYDNNHGDDQYNLVLDQLWLIDPLTFVFPLKSQP